MQEEKKAIEERIKEKTIREMVKKLVDLQRMNDEQIAAALDSNIDLVRKIREEN